MHGGHWVSSKKACEFYGVTGNTIRRWADADKVKYKRTPSSQRIYFIPASGNCEDNAGEKNDYLYCRVSSSKQKDDLGRQCEALCSEYPNHRLIKDIGSGLNFKRKGLLKLLDLSNKGRVRSIVVSSKDRLCRFGFELLQWQLLQNSTELVVLEQIDKSPEQEFSEDILAILQVFACRWNGKRRYTLKNKENKVEININPEKTS